MLFTIILATFVVSLISLVGLILTGNKIKSFINYFIAFAAGSMIAAAFFDLIPEALSEVSDLQFGLMFVVLGVGIFFLIETFIHWHHCGKEVCGKKPAGVLIFTGDFVHNFVDGLLIASSFMLDYKIGLVTTLLVIIHEIPQEFGDFAVLLHSGYSKWQAIKLNFASALSAIAGGIIGYYALKSVEVVIPYAVLIAAGGFLYISLSDIIPELHSTKDRKKRVLEAIVFVFSMILMKLFLHLLGI
ncbi:MAG: ZIP family metal transporter [Nanoarchaeota archaeon]|jgi:zinc and cadmium transporter|nr:ZIP family metal transporter [Nanoarchaeota archaeon]